MLERARRRLPKRCAYCGSREKLTVDHIKARSLGGTNHLSNLQTLCDSCNAAKSREEHMLCQGLNSRWGNWVPVHQRGWELCRKWWRAVLYFRACPTNTGTYLDYVHFRLSRKDLTKNRKLRYGFRQVDYRGRIAEQLANLKNK